MVLRTKFGMTRGLESHVGSRTTFWVLGDSVLIYEYCDEVMIHYDPMRVISDAFVPFHGTFPNEHGILRKRTTGILFDMFKQHLGICGNYWPRSVGLSPVLFPLPICNRISVHGFNSQDENVPRHCYEAYEHGINHSPQIESCRIEWLRWHGFVDSVGFDYNTSVCTSVKLKTIPKGFLNI